jgi:hypothetical protein
LSNSSVLVVIHDERLENTTSAIEKTIRKMNKPAYYKVYPSISVCYRSASSSDPGCERPQPDAAKAGFGGNTHTAEAGSGGTSHTAEEGFGGTSHNAGTEFASGTISCGRSICCKYLNDFLIF